jgi:hypothetical protein
MNRSCSFALRAMVVGFALSSPAFAYDRSFRDDQVPYGPNGTIGRGTDSAGDRWFERSSTRPGANGFGNIYSNFSGVFSSSDDLTPDTSYVPTTYSVSTTARPYRTNRFYQPGDGYRYPLYYNPATRTYFYYPVRR